MKYIKLILVFILIMITCVSFVYAKEMEYAPGEVIVKFKSINKNLKILSVKQSKDIIFSRSSTKRKIDIKDIKPVFAVNKNSTKFTKFDSNNNLPDLSTIYVLKFDDSLDPKEVARFYSEDPNVIYAEPNYKMIKFTTPDDTYFNSQWGLHNIGQNISGQTGTDDKDMDCVEAWDITTGSTDVIVAVVDDGIDYTHEDLSYAIWVNTIEANGSASVDDDGNGYVDDTMGWDFSGDTEEDFIDIVPDNDPAHNGTDDHGTHVAGIIGAEGNNSKGITGVCQKVTIMPLKIFPNAYATVSAHAIQYAADNGARIINCSWGGTEETSTLHDAIIYARAKGALVVFAAGNSDLAALPYIAYPAYYSEAIAVAATDNRDKIGSFSNYGSWVDVSAPGWSIISTLPGNAYGSKQGTSMACPMVSGVLALLLSSNKDFTDTQLRQILEGSTDDIDSLNPGYEGMLGSGRVNAYKSISPMNVGTPLDGLTSDLDYLSSTHTLSGNWEGTFDGGIALKKYLYGVGTDTYTANVVSMVEVDDVIISTTIFNLSLYEGLTYYFLVLAQNDFDVWSSTIASDGVLIDTTPPNIIMTVSKSSPLKTGEFYVDLNIKEETSALLDEPDLSYLLSNNETINVENLEKVGNIYRGTSFIESHYPDGGIIIDASCQDLALNSTSTFKNSSIDASIGALGGMVSNSDGTEVVVPANTFSEPVNITINNKSETDSEITQGIKNNTVRIITGLNLFREFNAFSKSTGAEISTFNKNLTIRIPYPDINQDEIIDNTNIEESTQKMFYLDESISAWELIDNSLVSDLNNYVEALVNHFSIYGIMTLKTPDSINDVFLYPNPCYLNKNQTVTFTNIPLSIENMNIYIYNIAGEFIRLLDDANELTQGVGTRLAFWDGKNEYGVNVASGIYVYVIKSNSKTKTGRIAILK